MAPDANLLPNGKGLKAPLGCLTQARYGIAWGVVGAAMACFHEALEYSQGAHHVRQADRLVPAGAGRSSPTCSPRSPRRQLLALQFGRLKERGSRTRPSMVSMAKRNNCEIALDIAREARDILGANGITAEYPVMRHMCNLESVKTYEGTHDIHTLVLGEAVTGIPAYR